MSPVADRRSALVAAQRLAELVHAAAQHARRCCARGAVETGAAHYPLIVALHAAWLAALLVVGAGDTRPDLALARPLRRCCRSRGSG